MAIYAVFEDEKEMLKLYNKYPEEHMEMWFPFFALYYKLGDDKKAKNYLKKITESNPYFIKLFTDSLDEKEIDETTLDGYYQRGNISEIIMYMETYFFLMMTLPVVDEFILENI